MIRSGYAADWHSCSAAGRVEGLAPEALEHIAPAHWYDVLLHGPLFGQIARLQQPVRDTGRLGIATVGDAFSVAGV